MEELASMEFNRNHYFMIGFVVLLLGIQVHKVDTYVLNENVSEFVTKRLGPQKAELASQSSGDYVDIFGSSSSAVAPNKHHVKTKPWIGFALMSVGAVLVLHSFAMQRPT